MGALQPGVNKITWDGTNDKGVKLPKMGIIPLIF